MIFDNVIIINVGLFFFGLCVGSFLNVVIYRLPIMMRNEWIRDCFIFLQEQHALCVPCVKKTPTKIKFNLVLPRSACPHCHHPIKAYDNIPIFSYLFLKARCRHCQKKIPFKYPLVEFFTAILTLFLGNYYGLTPLFFSALFFSYTLLVLSFIDFEHQFLPDSISFPMLWLGLLLNSQHFYTDLTSALFGAVAGYLILWLVYQLFKALTGKEGMGHGDFKLLAVLGAWLGWTQLPFIILASSFFGSLVGIFLLIRGQDKNTPFAFGPYLALAGFIALLFGKEIIHGYLMLNFYSIG